MRYFYYTRVNVGNWSPCLDTLDPRSRNWEHRPAIQNIVEVEDDTLSFSQLVEMYPAPRPRTHLKTGGVYEEIARGMVQTSTPLVDYDEVVVYVGEDGGVWVRPVSEFDDGRFS